LQRVGDAGDEVFLSDGGHRKPHGWSAFPGVINRSGMAKSEYGCR
jgi:hypothetical protein